MLAFIIAPFLIALLIFIYIRTIKHIEVHNFYGVKTVEIIVGSFLFGGIIFVITGFLLPKEMAIKRIFTQAGYYWIGFILYFFVGLVIALFFRLIIWIIRKNKGYDVKRARDITLIFVILFTIQMSVYGITNAHNLHITEYEITSNKKSKLDELNIVLISDLHLGYNVGKVEMIDMVKKINSCNPDVVVLAGDIFDNEYEAIENPGEIIDILSQIKTKYGKYATYGNHDIEEKILLGFTFNWSKESKTKVQADERMNQFVRDAGFEFLYDSSVMIADSVYIYGRPDAKKINFGNMVRKTPEQIVENLDLDYEIICVDHQPSELHELADVGVDLDLGGHTHNGQFWPGTISIKWFWENAYGLKKIDNMTSIVSSGVGLFGFNMRTGCFPEIVNIKLRFEK